MNCIASTLSVALTLLFTPLILLAQPTTVDINISEDPVVGEPIEIEVVGYNPQGIAQLTLLLDGNTETQIIKDCGGATNCTLSETITQDYKGNKTVFADLRQASNGDFTRNSTVIDVKCDQEYCPPDPVIESFFQWMRDKDYPECITSKYLEFSKDALLRNGGRFLGSMKTFLRKRPIFNDTIINISLIDLIPTDPEATYKSLSIGETDSCTYDNTWADLCPEPIPADYKYLEAHLRRTFGIHIVLNYDRMEIDYANRFGGPSLNSGQYQFDFSRRRAFIRQFPTNSIVHWAVETWNGRGVFDMTGASHVAEIDYEPSTSRGLYVTTHEWGHTLGLRNNGSGVLPHPFQTRDGESSFFQLDGIMSNTYKGRTHAIDPLDPLERYACEPPMGYLDKATFVQEYYDGILGWRDELNFCGPVDVALKSLEIINQTSESLTLEIEVQNTGIPSQYGLINTGFVQVGLVNDQQEVEEMRTIEYIDLDTSVTMQWTINNCDSRYSIVIDPLNKIKETDEENNEMGFSCVLTATQSVINGSKYDLYPNPTKDLITIKSDELNQTAKGSLISLRGELLEGFDIHSHTQIDLSTYPSGVYFLQIQTDEYSRMKKIVKE